MKLTDSQFQKIFEDKRYWRQIWLEIVDESARENLRQVKTREASQQSGSGQAVSSSHGPFADSSIGEASTFALSESEIAWRAQAAEILQRDREESKGIPRQPDSSLEVKTISPSPRTPLLVPKTRDDDQVQRFSASQPSESNPMDSFAKILVDPWNAGKPARDGTSPSKIFRMKNRNRHEVNE